MTFFLGVELLKTGALYALLSLDHMAVGPFMFFRPLVVGPLVGWFLGNPLAGFLAGAVSEMLWMDQVLTGIGPMDLALVTSLSVFWALTAPTPHARAALALAMLLAVPCGMLMSRLDIWSRRQNNRFIPWIEKSLAAGHESVLPVSVGLSLSFRFIKGCLVFSALGAAGGALMRWGLAHLSARALGGLDFLGKILPLLALASAVYFFYDRARQIFPTLAAGRGEGTDARG